MKPYVLSCCSGADLSREHFDRREIRYLYFHFEVGGIEYQDDLGKSMPPEELYQRMIAGESTKTSQVSIGEYTEHFERFLKEGQDVLHVTLSSGISGTFNSARLAAEDLAEKYPERKIYVVDSLAASSGYGLFMDALADQRDRGMDIDALYQWAEERKTASASLVFLHRSDLFYPGRPDIQNSRVYRNDAQHLSADECQSSGATHPEREGSHEEEGHQTDRGKDDTACGKWSGL